MRVFLVLPIAAASIAAMTSLGTIAAPVAADAASSSASGTAASTKDSRALMNQRTRKCKAMNGDEKTACEKDAHTVSEAKARSEKKVSNKP